MKKTLLIALTLIPLMSLAQNRVQNYIDQRMKTDSLLINAVVGILAVDSQGREIAAWNPDMPLLTASTMKTITTGLGYEVLGPGYRFSTRVAYDGRIENGVLHGNLYIVGGADPTLGSRDTIAFPIDSIFGIWADAVKKAGIRRINGRIVGDDRIYEEENIPSSWSYGNIGYDYGSGTSGLSFCENLSYFDIEAGEAVGDPVRITPVGPYSPYMTFINEVTTGEKGDGDNTEYYASSLTPIGKFVGTFGIDAKPRTLAQSNKYGPATCAAAFSDFLRERGIGCKGVSDVRSIAYDYAVPPATTSSPRPSSKWWAKPSSSGRPASPAWASPIPAPAGSSRIISTNAACRPTATPRKTAAASPARTTYPRASSPASMR